MGNQSHMPVRAIVSGGANGVGAALVSQLAESGAQVAFLDINRTAGVNLEDRLRRRNLSVEFVEADVSQNTVCQTVTALCARLGGIDALFNHAGTILVAPFLETTESQWQHLLRVNLMSMVYMCQAVIPHMIRDGGGSIVNTSSISGLTASALESAYCVTKGACNQLTRAIAVEFRDHGIRCNAVCPAFIRTAHGERELQELARLGEPMEPHTLACLQGRMCEPEEVARVAVFLSSKGASFVSGEMVTIDNAAMART
jgi:NAD(P)-dependent dehydrogenase (short-subunit alcohol dehydrogenase family)